MEKYDSTYIWTRHEDGYPIRYRRDRVVEYKDNSNPDKTYVEDEADYEI